MCAGGGGVWGGVCGCGGVGGGCVCMLSFQTENGKRKPWQFFLIRLPLAHHARVSLLLIHMLTNKRKEVIPLQTEVIRLQTN